MASLIVNGRQVGYNVWHEDQSETLVLFHGFTGSAKGWASIAAQLPEYRIVAFDMIGHGESDAPSDASLYEMAIQTELLAAAFEALKLSNVHLLGYSMGGRIALSFACAYPQFLRSLTLESATAGLEAQAERIARQEGDAKLALKIDQEGLEAFIDFWERIPLFESHVSLPLEVQKAMRAERMGQHPEGLANSLRGIGTGQMPSVWDKLTSLQMPVHLIVGERDEKFININKKMAEHLQNVYFSTISGAGHTIHVENPVQFVKIVKELIFKFEEEQSNDNS